jgi:single-strand DNA-binding protein
MSVNRIILVGNVGKEPEIRYLDSGVALCKFPLATNEKYKNKNGENVKNTEWHNIILWRKLAEIAEKYVKKGDLLYLEGKIRTRSYDDKEGNKRYITEVIVDNMQMLGKKQSGEGADTESYQEQMEESAPQFDQEADNETDDLPF